MSHQFEDGHCVKCGVSEDSPFAYAEWNDCHAERTEAREK